MHHEWPAVPDPDFEIREGGGGGGGRCPQKSFVWSKNKGGRTPGSFPWIRHRPVGKAIVDLPTRLKGNSKSTTQSVGGPEQGSQRCFTGVTRFGYICHSA